MWSKRVQLGVLMFLYLAASVPADTGAAKSAKQLAHERRSFPVNELPPLTYSAKKYSFYPQDTLFFSAWRQCSNVGKRLATIENFQDYEAYLKALSSLEEVNTTHFWIAGTNLGALAGEYQKFYWITNDRPVGYVTGFEKWVEGVAPNLPNLCIATFLESASWVYGFCDTSLAGYACEESQDV